MAGRRRRGPARATRVASRTDLPRRGRPGRRSRASSSGSTLSWALPKRSTHSTSAYSTPSSRRVRGRARAAGRRDRRGGPNSSRGTPRQRWAAAGAKTSRPAKVGPGAGSCSSGLVSSTARLAPPTRPLPAPAARCPGRPGPRRRRPPRRPPPGARCRRPGSTTASTTPGQRYWAARARHRPPARTSWARHLVGDVDHADAGGDLADHRFHHADELVGGAVVGEEGDRVVAEVVRGGHAGSAGLGVALGQELVDVLGTEPVRAPDAQRATRSPDRMRRYTVIVDTRSCSATSATVRNPIRAPRWSAWQDPLTPLGATVPCRPSRSPARRAPRPPAIRQATPAAVVEAAGGPAYSQ